MRILHVVPSYLPAVRYGGPIYSVHGLAKATAARGHDVHVFTTNVDGGGISDVPVGVPIDRDGVAITYFPCGMGRRIFRSPAMARALASAVADFDVLHLHSVFLWPTAAAARGAQRAGKPYVISPRGMLVADLIRRKNRLAKTAWIAAVERANLQGAAAIHVTSRIERREIEQLGLSFNRYAEIPNGIDPPPATALNTAAGSADDPYILSLGRINWKKGLEHLIGALAGVPRIRLVLAGNDEEGHGRTLARIAAQCGVADRVTFAGAVYGPDKWRLIRGATIFAMPSHSENFGNAALEAMACGVPVLLSPGVGLAAEVQAAGAGVVAQPEPAALAAALNEVLADPARREHMGRAGLQLARDRYAWPAIAQAFDALYLSLMDGRQQ